MRVLLDEPLRRDLARAIAGHEVQTVQGAGWAGLTNGELLRVAAAAGFATLVTADRNLEHQQNVRAAGLGLVVLRARSTACPTCCPSCPRSSRPCRACSRGKFCTWVSNEPLKPTGALWTAACGRSYLVRPQLIGGR